jgi:PAS domain S-box-containing protein
MNKYFQLRVQLFTTLIAIGWAGTLILTISVALNYETLIRDTATKGINDLTELQKIQSEIAKIHTKVINVITQKTNTLDEQSIYLESKRIANSLDQIKEKTKPLELAEIGENFIQLATQDAIDGYRTGVVTALEMLTVNQSLAQRYLLRSAITLSEVNIAIGNVVEKKNRLINERVISEVSSLRITVAISLFIAIALSALILALSFRLTRQLKHNFTAIEKSIAAISAPISVATPITSDFKGEFGLIGKQLDALHAIYANKVSAWNQLQAVFDSILEAIVVIDAHGKILQVNKIAKDLFGYSLDDELIGKNIKILTPPGIATKHDYYLKHFRENGDSGTVIARTRNAFASKRDGTEFPVEISVNEVNLEGKKHFVGVIADITSRIKNEKRLIEEKGKAEESARIKAEILANMSHEIRTPMNGILGTAQLLVGAKMTDAERNKSAQLLLRSSEILLTLLNDILDLSKIESGKFTINPKPTLPAEVASMVAALFVDAAKAKDLKIITSVLGLAQEQFYLDASRVQQMLSNYLGNAIKFTQSGHIEIEVGVLLEKNGREVLKFSVKDSGPGIAQEDLSRLFNKYSQIHDQTKDYVSGSGLGLAIVKNLANAMNGDAGVESYLGKGSTFWFTIPAKRATKFSPNSDAQPLTFSSYTECPPPLIQKKQRALVAEDLPANQFVLQMLLRSLDVDAHLVGDGLEALEAVKNNAPFDFIFMDMRMPRMDGKESARLIRQWEAQHSLPGSLIIAVTANAFESDQESCKEAGMDYFLAKPINAEALKSLIMRIENVGTEIA